MNVPAPVSTALSTFIVLALGFGIVPTAVADDTSDTWAMAPIEFEPTTPPADPGHFVVAERPRAPVYTSTSGRYGRGSIHVGQVLPATRVGRTGGCSGTWYRIGAGGFICSANGFDVVVREPEGSPSLAPRVDLPLPFHYALVTDRSTFRWDRLPNQRQLDRVGRGRRVGAAEKLDGDYFVALPVRDDAHETFDAPGGPYYRSVAGRYVPVEAVEFLPPSALRGSYDAGGLTLPMAFVIEELRAGARVLQRYERFPVQEVNEDSVETRHGRLDRSALRIVKLTAPPSEIEEGEKWIHVDLDEQVLVAYEGERPVFATLIASGKEGYDTPTGTFQIRHKYITTTMRGDDPNDGVYDVAEVPWTMYYDGSYALHGAYWHDTFGNVRSHGCTNIAPADARWLFGWTAPVIPEGWHGVRDEGTYVVLTRAEDE